MREHLYDIITKQSRDSEVIKDIKQKMYLKWDMRLPSMGIYYLASLLDPSLKHLQSLLENMEAGNVTEFVTEMLEELNIRLEDIDKVPRQLSTASLPSPIGEPSPKVSRLNLIRKYTAISVGLGAGLGGDSKGRLAVELAN